MEDPPVASATGVCPFSFTSGSSSDYVLPRGTVVLNFSLEMIDYQVKDRFPVDLSKIVSRIFDDLDVGMNNQDVIKKHGKDLTKVIKGRLGLNVEIDPILHYYLPAAILPFSSDYMLNANRGTVEVGFKTATSAMVNMFHPSYRDVSKHLEKVLKERELSMKKIHNKKGFVNTKHARVGGYLSEVRHYLIVNYEVLKKELGLTVDEVVAVVLHELGHAFVGLETHYKLNTTNSAISDILEELNKNKVDVARYKFKRYFGDQELIESAIGEDSEVVDFYGPLARRYMKDLNSLNMNAKYDETNFENLADNFATRFGVGKDLVTGLHKIHMQYDMTIHTSKARMYVNHLVNLLAMAAFAIVFIPPMGGVLIGLLLAFSGTANTDMTYDLPLDRYNRVKNAIVGNLKDKGLPVEYTRSLIEQFESIDYIIQNTYQRKGILDTVADFFIPKNRDAVYYRAIQQDVENALNNVLFVNSAKLRIT